MSEIETSLKAEFPEATEAEVKRFIRACEGPKKDASKLQEDAQAMLEDYLDWRSCYGLDYQRDENEVSSDEEDWKFSIEKTLQVQASIQRAKELAEKLKKEEEEAKNAEPKKVSYDVEVSDSKEGEEDSEKPAEAAEATETKESTESESKEETTISDEDKKRALPQIIFMPKNAEGQAITDKDGFKILQVIPAMINRQVAYADFYSLVLSFYLDRKLDRSSEEKMTVVIDLRPGDGWANAPAYMMVRFVHTVTKDLQLRYPERLNSLVLYPVPWVAMGVWNAMKQVFAMDIANRVFLVSGPADRNSPLPKEKLLEKMDDATLELTEKLRLDHFISDKPAEE